MRGEGERGRATRRPASKGRRKERERSACVAKASNEADLRQVPSPFSAPFQRAAAWPHLPEAVKAGILAMVAASRKS